MRKIGLLSLLSLMSIIAFAAFPVETQIMLTETDPDKFRLHTLGFIIGILTLPLQLIFALPCFLLFINTKHFRKSLAWGWLAGLVLVIILAIVSSLVPSGGLFIY